MPDIGEGEEGNKLHCHTGFHHVGQAGLELLTSGDLPTLASKVLGLQAVPFAWNMLLPFTTQLIPGYPSRFS
ncbi:Podocalyxin [Plecturocebus cupreus]